MKIKALTYLVSVMGTVSDAFPVFSHSGRGRGASESFIMAQIPFVSALLS